MKRKVLFILFIVFILFTGCSKKNASNYCHLILNTNGGVWEDVGSFYIDVYTDKIENKDDIAIIDGDHLNYESNEYDRILIKKIDNNVFEIKDILMQGESCEKSKVEYDFVILGHEDNCDKEKYQNFYSFVSFNSKSKYIKFNSILDDYKIIEEIAYVYNSYEEAKDIYEFNINDNNINNIELGTLKKVGYTFLGWYANSNFEGICFDSYTKGAKTEDTLYAKFSLNVYTISYYFNGGTCDSDLISNYTINSSDIVLPKDLKKDKMAFGGWYYDKEYNGKKVEILEINKNQMCEDIKLYAHWQEKEISEYSDSEKVEYAKQMLIERYQDLKEIETDLELIEKDLQTNAKIEWTSSNNNAISNEGKYTRNYIDEHITLNALITYNECYDNITFDVIALGFKDIKNGNVKSSYIYRNYDSVGDSFFDSLDIITCAFAKLNSNGSVSGTNFFSVCSKKIIPIAHEKGTWVIMSISPESEWTTVCDPSNNLIEEFANNIVNAINTYGFDGVDLDWECPKSSQKTWFTNLVQMVYKKVKENNPNHLVTAAIGGGKWQSPNYDLENSCKYLDFINMMTYGMTSNSGYYQNALYSNTAYNDTINKVGRTLNSCSIEESIAIYDKYNVPHKKIIVGLAFYGVSQKREYDSATNTYSEWKKGGSIFYTSIKNNYLNNSDYIYVYDSRCQVPYIISKDKTFFISFDDITSIKAKCKYVSNNKLGGVMYWENGCDTTGDLLKAITF